MSELNENDFPPLEPQPFVTEEGREIERIRAELAAETATTASLLRSLALIREAGGWQKEMLGELPDAVKAMREQRDEAQCEACELRSHFHAGDAHGTFPTAKAIAAERGWDCFAKEGGGA